VRCGCQARDDGSAREARRALRVLLPPCASVLLLLLLQSLPRRRHGWWRKRERARGCMVESRRGQWVARGQRHVWWRCVARWRQAGGQTALLAWISLSKQNLETDARRPACRRLLLPLRCLLRSLFAARETRDRHARFLAREGAYGRNRPRANGSRVASGMYLASRLSPLACVFSM
jgi:hypothetical protein